MAETPQITGFGGFFFRAKDPEALAQWYLEMFGIDRVPSTYDVEPWHQKEGPTVFAPFQAETDFFGPDMAKTFMFNFRVNDLAAMIAHLEAKGVAVERDPETYPNGVFASLFDPEGNPIQLWEPQHNTD